MSTLYLIPVPIGKVSASNLPVQNLEIISLLKVFIVERARTARRMIKVLLPDIQIENLVFYEMDKHNDHLVPPEAIEHFKMGVSIGLLSESGLPCIADPGNEVVNIARKFDYRIKPLVGPSSLFMGLMASGLNGQAFEFHGYLPTDTFQLTRVLKEMDRNIRRKNKTHIFIETPYRNYRLLDFILKTMSKDLRLCLAMDIDGPGEKIQTHRIDDWRKRDLKIFMEKQPMVFLVGL